MATEKSTSKLPDNPIISIETPKPDLRKKDPPLVDIKVSNPVTYIKSWWKKIMGNEGIEIRLKVKPLTAIAISIIIVTLSMGIGRFVLPFKIPFFEYNIRPTATPTAVTQPFRETGFVGEIRHSLDTDRYYLITASSEAVILTVPDNVDLIALIGRRIFATGKYYPDNRLYVESVEDLEVLPSDVEPVPTNSPSPEYTPNPSSEPTISPTASPSADVED